MARRLIYAVLAADVVALIAGFFIKTSSVPLWVSTGLSVGVAILILFGWSRIVRDEDLDADTGEKVEELDVDERIDVEERPRRRKPRTPKLDETITIEPPDESLFAPPKPRASRAKPKSKPKRARPKAKAKAKPAKPKVQPMKPRAKPVAAKSKAKPPVKKTAARKPGGKRVAVVPGASKYHTPTCRFARSDNVRMVPERVAKDRGYVACDVCKP